MGNTKLILGLVWLLILRFQIKEGGGGGTQELLDWCNSVLNPQVHLCPRDVKAFLFNTLALSKFEPLGYFRSRLQKELARRPRFLWVG